MIAAQQLRKVALQLREQPGVIDDAVFDDFGQAGAVFAFRQGLKRVEIAQHQPGLVKCAHQIFARLQVNADLSADGAVHLRQQGRRYLHERDAAQISRRDKSGQIADHAAAQRDNKRFSFEPVHRQLVITALNRFQALGTFTGRNHDQGGGKARPGQGIEGRLGEPFADVGVGDDGTTRAEFQARTSATQGCEQAATDSDLITPIAERYVNSAHTPRIKTARDMSKFCQRRHLFGI